MTATRFRKKPVVIDAVQWTGDMGQMLEFINTEFSVADRSIDDEHPLFIPTLEGEMRADIGDWIIRGVQGEYYPCKPDIFAKTYEPVTEG